MTPEEFWSTAPATKQTTKKDIMSCSWDNCIRKKNKVSTNVGLYKVQKASRVRTLMIYEAFSVLVQYSSWQLAKPLIMWCVSCSSHGADPPSLIIFMSVPSGPRQRVKLYIKMMGKFLDPAFWIYFCDLSKGCEFRGMQKQNPLPSEFITLKWSLSVSRNNPFWINLDAHWWSKYRKGLYFHLN